MQITLCCLHSQNKALITVIHVHLRMNCSDILTFHLVTLSGVQISLLCGDMLPHRPGMQLRCYSEQQAADHSRFNTSSVLISKHDEEIHTRSVII